jgi:hypothetical protein
VREEEEEDATKLVMPNAQISISAKPGKIRMARTCRYTARKGERNLSDELVEGDRFTALHSNNATVPEQHPHRELKGK